MTAAAGISGFPHALFSALGQLFIAWGPDFKGSVKLDGKKITALFALPSN